jgi:glutamate-1-semialdehyde 2,1-aminomutase
MTEKVAARLDRRRQLAMYRRACRTLPGGTDSNFRAWGDRTVYVERGKGGRVWDIDGNEYVDLRMGYGPVILGHADERVDDHVAQRMRQGVSFSLTTDDEVRACELLCNLTFCDMARLTVSGTEATMHAIRVARGYTGRDKIVKFEGQYHGVHDYALISVTPNDMSELGDEDNPVALAWGRGIPEAVSQTIVPARFNRLDVLRRIFERDGDDIAAVIVEPILGNAQAILPRAGFHEEMRALTREFGALLIFDEVKTRRSRVLRRHAGPRHVREGDRQRLSGRRVRGHRRGHGHAAGQGQPWRHLRRQPGGCSGGGRDAPDPA